MQIDDLVAAASRVHASTPLDVLAALTLHSLVPLGVVTCTSFVRIVVVLSLVRSAIGASAVPPNAVLSGLALVLTLVVMAPTFSQIGDGAIGPYARGRLSQSQALERAATTAGNKGGESMAAALEMASLMARLSS